MGNESHQITPRRWRFRLSIRGMMVLVAIAAIAIFAFDRLDRPRRAKIKRTIAILKVARPDLDWQEYQPISDDTSTFSCVVQFDFQSRKDPQKQIRVIYPTPSGWPRP